MATPPLHPDVIEYLDDESLIEAYQQIDGKPRDPIADRIAAEVERRNLGI